MWWGDGRERRVLGWFDLELIVALVNRRFFFFLSHNNNDKKWEDNLFYFVFVFVSLKGGWMDGWMLLSLRSLLRVQQARSVGKTMRMHPICSLWWSVWFLWVAFSSSFLFWICRIEEENSNNNKKRFASLLSRSLVSNKKKTFDVSCSSSSSTSFFLLLFHVSRVVVCLDVVRSCHILPHLHSSPSVNVWRGHRTHAYDTCVVNQKDKLEYLY